MSAGSDTVGRDRGLIAKKGDAPWRLFVETHRDHAVDSLPLTLRPLGQVWTGRCPCGDYFVGKIHGLDALGEVFGRVA